MPDHPEPISVLEPLPAGGTASHETTAGTRTRGRLPQPRDAEPGRKPTDPEPLDNPVFSALSTTHAALAQRQGRALRYPADVSPFMALPSRPDGDDWLNLALLARGDDVVFFAPPEHVPHHWEKVFELEGMQMVEDGIGPADDEGIVTLGPDDVPEMLDLAARTKPGPFLLGTPRLGTYLGIRAEGALVAMAGERFRFPGVPRSVRCAPPRTGEDADSPLV